MEGDEQTTDLRRDFLRRLDELNANVTRNNDLMEGLLELGHLLVLALGDAARAQKGTGVGELLGTLDKVASAWRETVGILKGKKR